MKHALAIIAAFILMAADAPPVDAPDIVVQAQLEREQEAKLRDFIAAMADTGKSDQLGRWNQLICPAVVGIAPAQAAFIEDRIGRTAAAVELRSQSHCRPSMLIIVTNDAAGLAAAFEQRAPITLRTDGRRKLKRFVASKAPVRWLTVTNLCPKGCALPNSRLIKPTNPAFSAMIVIVDAQQISGFGMGEIADYLAVVALTNPPPDARKPQNSILSMFEKPRPEGARFELTDYDRSFMTALYKSPTYLGSQAQRGSIAAQMRKDQETAP